MEPESIVALLRARAAEHGAQRFLLFPADPVRSDALKTSLTFEQLYTRAQSCAARLLREKPEPGARVLLVMHNDEHACAAFFGVLLAGLVPVPLSPPTFVAHLAEHHDRIKRCAAESGAQLLITPLKLAPKEGIRTVPMGEWTEPAGELPRAPSADDTALIQYTSGSTATPRGVELLHRNLLANVRGIGIATRASPDDVVVSWLPLYHDMGLIGALLFALYWRLPLVLMAPGAFLLQPAAWLWALSRFKGTLSPAPNFAYQLCVSKIRSELSGMDLRAWRVAYNGSEMVQSGTLAQFQARFGPVGFAPETMFPVYGMAENTLAACFPPLGRAPLFEHIDRRVLETQRRALPCEGAEARARQVVSVGRPLEGQSLRVIAPDGRPCGEREVGELQLRGPCVMRGYFGRPDETAKRFDGEWLKTGDEGYLAGGELFVTGRSKETIKKGGKNYDAADVQVAVASVPGVRRGCVAAFGLEDAATGTERLIILAETRTRDAAEKQALVQQIGKRISAELETSADDVVLLEPYLLPKTTSGKIRVAECKQRYASGSLVTAWSWWDRVRFFFATR